MSNIKKTFIDKKISKSELQNRNNYFKIFKEKGFPNKKLEDWKFLDLNYEINNQIPNLNFVIEKSIINKNKILENIPINIKEFNYVLNINGFVEEINFSHEDKSFIKIETNLEKQNKIISNALENLNLAFNLDYLCINIKEGYKARKPLIVLNVINKNIKSSNINKKFDIVLEKNAQISVLNLVQNYSKNNFFNLHQKFILNPSSILKNYFVDLNINQNLNYIKTDIEIEKNSISENVVISKNSDYCKNDIVCNLLDQFSSAFINGIIDLDNSQKHEIRTQINHLAENTKSYQLIKCVLNNQSKAVYQGKIYVDSKAQKTDGYQSSKAILLNENTEFNGKPELEIYADDVKCSHGSSSGNLDENKIFYLMTRGLNKNEAKKLLIDGYLMEVVDKITDERIKPIIKEIIKI